MSVSLVRNCQRQNCNRSGNRVVVGRCGFTNKWAYRGATLCTTHEQFEIDNTARGYICKTWRRIDWQAEFTTHPVAPETPVYCERCSRPLRSSESIRRGMGKHCARAARKAAEAVASSLSQLNKAVELITDAALVPLRGHRVWITLSEDGSRQHRTTAEHCTCSWGIRRYNANQTACYHMVGVRAMCA